ncbi:MAG: hypothetical protein AAFP70_13465, partial [Calditrichota bacterium]
MKDSFTTDRRDLNKDQLLNEIERVKRRICRSEKKKIADSNGLEDVILAESAISVPDLSVSEITGNLDLLVSVFGLSDFERDLVVLCAGVELDTNFLLGLAEGDEQKEHYATFGMALAFLESPHWSAISPSGPLRFWHIIELVDNHTVTGSRLFLDQRILNFLLGINYIDERLDPFKVFYQPRMPISNAQQEIASRSAGVWQEYPLPVLQYCGNQYSSKRNVAALACHLAGLHMVIFNAEALPGIQQGLDKTIRLWERESLLENKALLLDFDSVPTLETEHKRLLTYWLERSETPLILCCNERQRIPFRKILPFDIKKESASEQADRWQELIQKDY